VRKALLRCILLLLLSACLFASCSRERQRPLPVRLTRDHACRVCGMIIVDFPGAKAQIHYRNGRYDAFCSTLDMFLFYLQPDRPRDIVAIYVNDMGDPEGNWIDAEKAYYVFGGDVMGPMGESLVPFSDHGKAEAYIKSHGGRIVRFNEVTQEMLKPGRS